MKKIIYSLLVTFGYVSANAHSQFTLNDISNSLVSKNQIQLGELLRVADDGSTTIEIQELLNRIPSNMMCSSQVIYFLRGYMNEQDSRIGIDAITLGTKNNVVIRIGNSLPFRIYMKPDLSQIQVIGGGDLDCGRLIR